jgi:hypothetical protein
MRTLGFLIILAQLVFLGPLFLFYGQVDPCRALAKEMALRSEAEGGLGTAVGSLFGDPEIEARRDVAPYSTGECMGKLVTSWWERVAG